MRQSDIRIGDSVSFKSDIEQVGIVEGFERVFGTTYVRLMAPTKEGFIGNLIKGQMFYSEVPDRLWI